MTKKDIRRAAYRLKQWSDVLFVVHREGGPKAATALAEAEEMHDLSKKLYAMARCEKSPSANTTRMAATTGTR